MLLRDYYRLLKQSPVLPKMWALSVYGPFTGEVHPRILTGPFQLRIFCEKGNVTPSTLRGAARLPHLEAAAISGAHLTLAT